MNKELENNRKQRMEFVEKWANFVVNNDSYIWSSMQSELIDSQIESAKEINLSRKQVDYIKKK